MQHKKEKKWERKTWEETEFTKSARLKEDVWKYILLTKGKKTIAGRLDEIVRDYMGKEVQQ